MGIKVGIDLGTTFSAVAVYDEKAGKPVIIKNPEGERITPSVIHFEDDGEIVVGSEAKESFESGEPGCISVFKRSMGDSSPYCTIKGKSYTAEDLSAILLSFLKKSTEQVCSQEIDEAVVTVPAYFYQQERAATMRAARRAGLNVRQIINEPVAAAMTYAVSHWRENAVIMVYDLGGGTFDVTMVQMQEYGVMRSLETTGNHILGGKDWDEALTELIKSKLLEETGIDADSSPILSRTVIRQAEIIKKKLTQFDSTELRLKLPDYGEYKLTVTLDEFNAATRPLLERTGSLCLNLLEGLGLGWEDVTDILLVGGSTRMRQVPAYLRELSGHDPISHVDPDEAVALGAAIQVHLPAPEYLVTKVPDAKDEAFTGRIRMKKTKASSEESVLENALSIRCTDIVAHAMGIIAVNDAGTHYINKTIIPANQQIPCKCAEAFRFYTTEDGKNEMEIYVLQGTAAPAECNITGKYRVTGIPHDKHNNPRIIRIQYSYDINAMIHVQARLEGSERDLPIREETPEQDISRFARPIAPGELSVVQDNSLSVMLALDVSGSMRGSPIRNAKKAMCSFVDKMKKKGGDVRIGVMVVSDNTLVCQELTSDLESCKAAIKEIKVEMTGIGNAWHPFYKINDLMKELKGKRYAVVLADGVWMNPARAVDAARECHVNGIEIIGMGFGDADKKFMRNITFGSMDSIMLEGSKELEMGFGTIAQEISAVSSTKQQSGKAGAETAAETWTAINELQIGRRQ